MKVERRADACFRDAAVTPIRSARCCLDEGDVYFTTCDINHQIISGTGIVRRHRSGRVASVAGASPRHADLNLTEIGFRGSQRTIAGQAIRKNRKGREVVRALWERVTPARQFIILFRSAVGRELRRTREGVHRHQIIGCCLWLIKAACHREQFLSSPPVVPCIRILPPATIRFRQTFRSPLHPLACAAESR